VDAEKALLAHLPEQLMRREDAGRFPFLRMRVDLGLDEPGDRAHQLAVLFGIEHACPHRKFLPPMLAHPPWFTKHLLGKTPLAC
jgi:hypothetical protein